MSGRQREIIEWTAQLVQSLGLPRAAINETGLRKMHAERDYTGMVRAIRTHLKLDVRMRIGFVKSGGPEEVPAWIEIPNEMPMYGTRAFRELMLTLYIRRSVLDETPPGAMICIISHELSHIVLDAIKHPLRRQEEVVDLTAMLLGYREVFVRDAMYALPGECCSVSFGYLSPEEREYAAWIMSQWPK